MGSKKNTIFAAALEDVKGTLKADVLTDAIGLVDFSLTMELEQIARDIMNGTLTPYDPLVGKQNAGFEVTCELRGSGVHATAPEIAQLLEVCWGTQRIGADGTVKASPAPTTTEFTISGSADFAVGDLLLVAVGAGQEVCWVTSATPGSSECAVVVSPALSVPPSTSATVKNSVMYKLASTGHKSVSAYFYIDGGYKISFRGAQGTCKFSDFAVGKSPKIVFSMTALEWVIASASCGYTPSVDRTLKPPVVLGASVKIDNSEAYARKLEFDLGLSIAKREAMQAASGVNSLEITERKITGKLDPYLTALTDFTAWAAMTTSVLNVKLADILAKPNIIGLRMPRIMRNKVALEDADGSWANPIDFTATGTNGNDEAYLGFLKTP